MFLFSSLYTTCSRLGAGEGPLQAGHGAGIVPWNHKNKSGWTPPLIAEGHRGGNFKPSPVTVAAFHNVMKATGLVPPSKTDRLDNNLSYIKK